MKQNDNMQQLLKKVRQCQACSLHLPFKPRPIIQASPHAKILIIGQAPGSKVQNSGIPWDDRSGDRLRTWLNLEKDIFYDDSLITIMPMAFCYPGVDKNGGDKPPRPECAPLWHSSVLNLMPNTELTLLVGSYAQKYYLKEKLKPTLHETVLAWKEYHPNFIPLPHPSWRNTGWLKQNPWFEKELLPFLRKRMNELLILSER